MRTYRFVVLALAVCLVLLLFPKAQISAQPAMEDRLVILTPVARTVADPMAAAFREFARRQFNVTVTVTIVSAGTPTAYGRIREWAGRPEADLFWGGEPALFDDLAERRLLVPHEIPEAVTRDIPATLGTPKALALKATG
jgi:iron(III) transport system substrate-binding protein